VSAWLVYYIRRCESCSLVQLQASGPMGDKGWTNLPTSWRNEWEEADFYSAYNAEVTRTTTT